MSKLAINTGATINDGTGDPLRDGAIKINSNFDEIYTNLGNNSSLLFSVDFTTPPQDMQVLQYSSATGKFEFNFSGGQGNTGVGISTANITSGNLIITLSNTATIDVGTVVGTTGNTGSQGPIGNTGVGISVANITSGNLIITLSDASTIDAGTVVGPIGNTGSQGPIGNTGSQGPIGNTGVGISTANITSGNLIITLSNTSTIDAGTVVGPIGNTGPQGPIGNTGIDISTANVIGGNLIITLSDASTIDAGTVVGPIGNTGPVGANGATTFAALTDNANLTIDKIYLPAITMLNVTNNGASAYRFDQYGVADNPTIYALNGATIAFNLNAAGHPFVIQTSANTNYNDGLTHVTTTGTVTTGASAQGKTLGTLYWKIPSSISGNYQYVCSNHPAAMIGVINIKDFSTI